MNIKPLLKKYIFLNEVENDFTKNIDFSHISLKKLIDEMKDASISNEVRNVPLESYILKFYGYNEYLNSLKNENNGIVSSEYTELLDAYKNFNNDFSKKLLLYILLSSVSESFHSDVLVEDFYDEEEKLLERYCELKAIELGENSKEYKDYLKSDDVENKSFADYLHYEYYDHLDGPPKSFSKEMRKNLYENLYSKKEKERFIRIAEKHKNPNYIDFMKFIVEINSEIKNKGVIGDDGDAQRYMVKSNTFENKHLKNLNVEQFLTSLSQFFLKDFEPGYGNKPWSDIVKHALSFVKGEISSEMFIDQALSLEHNNGHIFNKDFIFNVETDGSNVLIWYHNNNNKTPMVASLNSIQLLLHLQATSSVFSFIPYMDKLRSFTLYKGAADKYFKDSPYKIKKSLIPNAAKLATRLLDVFNDIVGINASFIKKIDLNNFNIADFSVQKIIYSHHEKEKANNLLPLVNSSNFLMAFDYALKNQNKIKETNFIKKEDLKFHYHNLNDINNIKLTKEDVGGKAKGLIELIASGYNVPKGMVFDTKTCLSYLENKSFFNKGFNRISSSFKDYLKDEDGTPIMVSVRSGAPISMPGMMDTILNVGIDDNTYPLLAKKYGTKTINQCVIYFMESFCSSKLNIKANFDKNLMKALDEFKSILQVNKIPYDKEAIIPLNLEKQIKLSIETVFDSWNSIRAKSWRNEKGISHEMGTAATIQKMVLGNKNNNSFTCVIFSRDCITGHSEITGEYLVNAQGEDLVSGKKTPQPISKLKEDNLEVYKKIEKIAKQLEKEHQAIQDIEITVEDNEVYVLQKRNAVVSDDAQLLLHKDLKIPLSNKINFKNLVSLEEVISKNKPVYSGLSASNGAIYGVVVTSKQDIMKYESSKLPLIFLSKQALPEHAPLMIKTNAFITEIGGMTSHAAILARSMSKPCIVGIGKNSLKPGDHVTLDAGKGMIWKGKEIVVKNTKTAEKMASILLKEKDVKVEKDAISPIIKINAWFAKFAKKDKGPKFNNFLSISQKAAMILLKEETKENKRKIGL